MSVPDVQLSMLVFTGLLATPVITWCSMEDRRITKGFLAKLELGTLHALRDRVESDIDIAVDPEEAMCLLEDLRIVESVIAVRELQCSRG